MQNTHYTWSNTSPITRLAVVPAKKTGEQTVYLYANAQMKSGEMAPLLAMLKQKGYADIYPDIQGDKNCLAIRHVKDVDALKHLLEKEKLAVGTPQTYQDQKVEVEGFTPSWIRQQAVRGAVLSASAATVLRGGSAWIRRDNSYLASVGLIIVSNLIQWIYGTGEEADAKILMQQSRDYLTSQGIEIPELEPKQQQSMLRTMERFIAKHPVETGYAFVIPSGLALLHSGMVTKNPWAATQGATMTAGASAVTFVPEKRRKPEDQEKPIMQEVSETIQNAPKALADAVQHPTEAPTHLWHFIQESPKRFNALISLLPGNVLSFLDAWHQTQNVNTHWREQNPDKITHLKQEIEIFKSNGTPTSESSQTHLNSLKKDLGKLERQVEIAEGAGGKAIPYLMFGGALFGTITTALVAIGTKNRFSQQMDMTNFDKLYSYAAQTLLALPKEQRENVFEHMTGFLANQPDVQDGFITLDKLKEEIHNRMEKMEQSPWIEPMGALREKEMGMGR